jgi:hypothetical protein
MIMKRIWHSPSTAATIGPSHDRQIAGCFSHVAYDGGMLVDRVWIPLLLVAACGGGGKKVEPQLPPEAYDEPTEDLDAGPDNAGEVKMAEVEANMGPVREHVQDCAAVSTFEGKVTVKVTIAPDGTATAEMVTASGQDDIDTCVLEAFDGVAFPTSERGQRFSYSFNF